MELDAEGDDEGDGILNSSLACGSAGTFELGEEVGKPVIGREY